MHTLPHFAEQIWYCHLQNLVLHSTVHSNKEIHVNQRNKKHEESSKKCVYPDSESTDMKENFLRFIILLLQIYQKNLKLRDLSWPFILFSIYPYQKTHQNTKYYLRKEVLLWKFRVRGLCTPDKLLFITKTVICTNYRNWVPSAKYHLNT